ncbi:unnamed protein product [Allacma fusca]|uniref:Trafficking protein particle complex subunit 4 n=1 Tax=Allacma fusca TaxID=39272 RepID=A0A8J2JZJ9_9HEXA|nr:unnamed protein product [Allacma fusca]
MDGITKTVLSFSPLTLVRVVYPKLHSYELQYFSNRTFQSFYPYGNSNHIEVETERTFTYPMDIKLTFKNHRTSVAFGQRDVGQTLLSVNGIPVEENRIRNEKLDDVFEFLSKPENYPVTCRFGRARLESNENLAVGSVFYSVFALASQLSPELHSSGIQYLETETFKLHCLQTLTGVKFFLISDPKLQGMDVVVRKIYELYSDYVLKNPFYSLDQPIRLQPDLYLLSVTDPGRFVFDIFGTPRKMASRCLQPIFVTDDISLANDRGLFLLYGIHPPPCIKVDGVVKKPALYYTNDKVRKNTGEDEYMKEDRTRSESCTVLLFVLVLVLIDCNLVRGDFKFRRIIIPRIDVGH